jgi:hypothetical protein
MMNMKNNIIQDILESETYKAAVSRIAPEEKKMVEEILHGKFSEVMAALQGFAERVQTDDTLRATFVQALNEKVGIVKNEEQAQPEPSASE